MIHVDRSISNAPHSRRREIFNNGFRQSFHLMTVLEGEVARHYVSKILSSTCQRWLLVATGSLVKTGPCIRSHIWMQICWPALIKRRGSIDRDKTPRYVSGQLLLHAMFDSHHGQDNSVIRDKRSRSNFNREISRWKGKAVEIRSVNSEINEI